MAQSNLLSVDGLLTSAQTNGLWTRAYLGNTAATTGATNTSGYVSVQRMGSTITNPAVGAGLTGMYITAARLFSSTGGFAHLCTEYSFGTLTVNGNSFVASGTGMPTKSIKGTSIQTVAQIPAIYVSSNITATTPVLTVTYTNQSGTAGRTATLTLPSNPSQNSVFLLGPHLRQGDTGVQRVTSMSISTGSAGTITAVGLLILGTSSGQTTIGSLDPLTTSMPIWLVEPSETMAVYHVGTPSPTAVAGVIAGVAETS